MGGYNNSGAAKKGECKRCADYCVVNCKCEEYIGEQKDE